MFLRSVKKFVNALTRFWNQPSCDGPFRNGKNMGRLIAELCKKPKERGNYALDAGTGEPGISRGILTDRIGLRQHAPLRSRSRQTRRRESPARHLPLGRNRQRHHLQPERRHAVLSRRLLQDEAAAKGWSVMDLGAGPSQRLLRYARIPRP